MTTPSPFARSSLFDEQRLPGGREQTVSQAMPHLSSKYNNTNRPHFCYRSRRCTAYLKASWKLKSEIHKPTVRIPPHIWSYKDIDCRPTRFREEDVYRLRDRVQDEHSSLQTAPFCSPPTLLWLWGLPWYPRTRIHTSQYPAFAWQGVHKPLLRRSHWGQEGGLGEVFDRSRWAPAFAGV